MSEDTHEVYERLRANKQLVSAPEWDDLPPWARRALRLMRSEAAVSNTISGSKTAAKAHSAAAKVMKDPKATKSAKSVAASVLTQKVKR